MRAVQLLRPAGTAGGGRVARGAPSGSNALAQAKVVEGMITSMIPKISTHGFSGKDVQSILVGLIDDGLAGQYTDYQGAEQAVMAVQSVADFMGRLGLLRTQPLEVPMKKLLATVSHDEKYRPVAFKKTLRDLKAVIHTETIK